MRIGLIDADKTGFPNLAIMKISAWHKKRGDDVEWHWGWGSYDLIYKSKVFTEEYIAEEPDPTNGDRIIKGGTGYGLENKLHPEIETIYPDYALYPEKTKDTAFGFLTRGCPRRCGFCVVSKKEGAKSEKVADLSQWWNGQKKIKLLDPNLTACKDAVELMRQLSESQASVDFTQGIDCRTMTEEIAMELNKIKISSIHFAWDFMGSESSVVRGLETYKRIGKVKDERRLGVYVLTNYNTTHEQDLHRVYKLKELGYSPYIMVYDKPNARPETRKLQRWVNNRVIFRSCEKFELYSP